jgi:hypothetical protein
MSLDENTSKDISYIPTTSSKKSGLYVYLSGVAENSDHTYRAFIDKLNIGEYHIDTYFFQNGRLHIFLKIDKTFTKGNIAIYKTVTTGRLLQAALPELIGHFKVERFDSLAPSEVAVIDKFSIIFEISAWIGVISIIMAILVGYGLVVEEYIISLQLIFLHVYIAADYLPLTFRDVIGGLHIVENLNFFLPSIGRSIEREWMGNVVQTGPVRFFLFNSDINFLR